MVVVGRNAVATSTPVPISTLAAIVVHLSTLGMVCAATNQHQNASQSVRPSCPRPYCQMRCSSAWRFTVTVVSPLASRGQVVLALGAVHVARTAMSQLISSSLTHGLLALRSWSPSATIAHEPNLALSGVVTVKSARLP